MQLLEYLQSVGIVLSVLVSVASLWYLRGWNRKKSTIDKLEGHEITDSLIYLDLALGLMQRADPIPLKEIEASREKYEDLDKHILILLTFYQSLSRGVKERVYDGRVVDFYRANSMIRAYCALFEHLEELRSVRNRPGLYEELEEYVRARARVRGIRVPRTPSS